MYELVMFVTSKAVLFLQDINYNEDEQEEVIQETPVAARDTTVTKEQDNSDTLIFPVQGKKAKGKKKKK